ncbi:hypothetical protein TNCV_5119531 [Trichonephila clavipes]|nr:hypothetical protein TNCV_5119531 [Trichonephila clavipes]
MPRGRHQASVDQGGRGRIVAYRDCGLSFREIGPRDGRHCDAIAGCRRKRRCRSQPPCCITTRDVHMAMDHAATSRAIAPVVYLTVTS